MLKLLAMLPIILLFGFGPQSPMRLMQLINRILPKFRFEFQIIERFHPETANEGVKKRKTHRKTSVPDSLF